MSCSPRSDPTRRRLDRRSGYFLERWTIRDSREWVCRQATGRTLEVGVGTGLNLRCYPADAELVAVDVDAARLQIAIERADGMSQAIRVIVADGHRLPFGPNTFETVVCTLALCDVSDRAAVLTEAHQVTRPGGMLLGRPLRTPVAPRTTGDSRRTGRVRDSGAPAPVGRLLRTRSAEEAGGLDMGRYDGSGTTSTASKSLCTAGEPPTDFAPLLALWPSTSAPPPWGWSWPSWPKPS